MPTHTSRQTIIEQPEDGVADAYVAALRTVLDDGRTVRGVTDPTSVGSGFGGRPRSYREVLGYSFRVGLGALSIPTSPHRCPDLAFACAQLLWVLSGSDEAAPIGFYNHRAEVFSDDGQRLAGAVGPRLGGGRAYLRRALDMLRADESSRRAIVPLIYPEDLLNSPRDFPCGLALHLLIRDGKLTAIGFMRSQSALMIMPYDLLLFRGIQHVLASELGIEVGEYVHVAGSLHVYVGEFELAKAVVDAPPQTIDFDPVSGGFGALDKAIEFETIVRSAACNDDARLLESLLVDVTEPPSDFWGETRLIVLHKAAATLRLEDACRDIERLLSKPIADALRRRTATTLK